MCYEAVDYVIHNSKQRCGARSVLLALANAVPRDGFGWWRIGYPKLAELAKVDRRHVMRLVWQLAEAGEIVVEWSEGGRAHNYYVARSPGEVEHNKKAFALVKDTLESRRLQKRPKQANSGKNVTVATADVDGDGVVDEALDGSTEGFSSEGNSDIFDSTTVTFLTPNSDIFDTPVAGGRGVVGRFLPANDTGPVSPGKRSDSLPRTFAVSDGVAHQETFAVDGSVSDARGPETLGASSTSRADLYGPYCWGLHKRSIVTDLVILTGDEWSWRRWGQLWDHCERTCRDMPNGAYTVWDDAVRALRTAQERRVVADPGAYFQSTLGAMFDRLGLPFPFGSRRERERVRSQVQAALAAHDAKSRGSPSSMG